MAAPAPQIPDDIAARLDRIEDHLEYLRRLWDEHGHILIAYRRGGMLAARTAARRGGDNERDDSDVDKRHRRR